MVAKSVPAARYAVIAAEGKQPEATVAAWRAVWVSDLPRTDSGDFDVHRHETGGARVDLQVAIAKPRPITT